MAHNAISTAKLDIYFRISKFWVTIIFLDYVSQYLLEPVSYLYRAHLITSAMVGFLPYMKMPTLYILAHTQIMNTNEA